MSVAARRARFLPERQRLRSWADRIDRAVANGRIPALLVVIVTGLMLAAFLFTDDFQVEAVAISGVRHGDAREVAEASGLLERSAFDADLEETAARVGALPYVESVSVELEFPGHATIAIQERLPALALSRHGESMLVSTDAEFIASGTLDGLPVLQAGGLEELPDERVTPELIAAVGAIAAVYGPGVDLVWSEDIGLAMETAGGRLVIFGDHAEMESKLVVLAAIEDQLDGDWTQLDLRVPTRPAYR